MEFNAPKLVDDSNRKLIKRHSHQPMTIDHYGIHAKISEDGKVTIIGKPDSNGEFDQVEVPAGLIFKLTTLLNATRTTEFVEFSKVEKGKE